MLMRALSLPSRITLIVVMALITVWLAAIGIFFLAMDRSGKQGWPSAERVSAIVALVEQASRAQQVDLLKALSSEEFSANVGAGPLQTELKGRDTPLSKVATQKYTDVLKDHKFEVSTSQQHSLAWRFLHIDAASRKIFGIHIQLASGDVLSLEAANAISVTPLGLPVGLPAGIFSTLVALVALVTIHRVIRPLSRLVRAVDQIDISGNFVPLPRTQGSAPEIIALVDAFDRLQTRLSQLLRARMAMLGGISHDVRTLATRLRLRVDLIPEGRERGRAVGDISDIIRLLDDALLSSRAIVGELSEEMTEFDLIVSSEVDDRRATGARISLAIENDAVGATVLGDILALRRIVSNLIDNALKYGGVANLSLKIDTLRLVFIVDDDGPGISPKMRDILLEPFVRLETSRNRSTGGSGLGLAIVRNLIEAHGGTVFISDSPSGGARFIISLPVFIPS